MADGTIKIDGRTVPFEKGDTVIKAAYKAGIDIPHYCWHPGLSAPANCRMCLVDVEPPPGRPKMQLDVLHWDAQTNDYVVGKKTKLIPACQQPCADGMSVLSDSSDEVSQARKTVQELLLLNHPVDCPICDQAGECDLQDYWLEHDRSKKRMMDEPVHKPKAEVFGETIVYDAERCIMCTRCIRVSKEVAKDPVLDMRQRGNRNEIFVAQGRTLDHEYSLMTEHVCPVGALTSNHFRFKARVWFLRSGRSVCQGCATGCNAYLDYDPRDNKPYRYRPRDNESVNGYWMCDSGMLSYPEAYEGRLETALVGGEDSDLADALEQAAEKLRGLESDGARVAIVLSAQHSCEDNLALAHVGKAFFGVKDLYVARRPDGEGDDILMHADKNSNSAGVRLVAEKLGLEPPRPMSALVEALGKDRYDYIVSLGAEVDCDASRLKEKLSKLKGFVALASHEGPLSKAAHIALPAASWAEAAGTYVNAKGHAQLADKVLVPRGAAHPAWQLVLALAKALGFTTDWKKRADLEGVLFPPALEEPSATPAPEAPATVEVQP
ncbi:MAG: (2Fe-2S)-binding protein [Deltaproteobacteria bacterium]|nr:(2Fe-2S)-binding protein [Deltaproteobacteria bacterium]